MSELGNAVPSQRLCHSSHPRHQIGIATEAKQPWLSSSSLPPELLLEVLARCDYETLVICATSSKFLCRCMRDDPVFLRRRPRGFAPSLFIGALAPPRGAELTFVEAPTPTVIPAKQIHSFVSSNADFLRSFDEILACGSGHVLLRRGRGHSINELCVWDATTGRHCFVPVPPVADRCITILAGEDAGSSSPFQLLAVRKDVWCWRLESQLYSSQEPSPTIKPRGAWGPVRKVEPPAPCVSSSPCSMSDNPRVVINRVAHWLCTSIPMWNAYKHDVLALHIDDGRAELIKGPKELTNTRNALLAITGDRRLSFVVAESHLISVFLLSKDSEGWEPHATVVREGILAQERDMDMRLDCFCQRSGLVVIRMNNLEGRLLLNLETKDVMQMPADIDQFSWQGLVFEMDLPSLIAFVLRSAPSP